MPLLHKYIDELTCLEETQYFCGEPVDRKSKILIIGTFNPDKNSCLKQNDATWFYGRPNNCFWKYLPTCLTGQSLHPSLGFTVEDWQRYCLDNKIVIVDLLKVIHHNQQLEDFKDKRLDDRLNNQITNVEIFDFRQAFINITFEKVIFTRKGWNPSTDTDILKLIQIKSTVNNILLHNNIVDNVAQIKYCPAPWQKRPTTQPQWYTAING